MLSPKTLPSARLRHPTPPPDLQTTPYPTPPPRARFFRVPTKTAHGVFGTLLNAVWDTVGAQILAALKARGLQHSALKTARFSSVASDSNGEETETFGPIVVWIAVRPHTTTAAAVRDATPAILRILADAQITGVVVEWYEGTVVRLAGGAPPLMRVPDTSNATFGLNHPFNAGLGIPIARESDDAQGTVTFLFKEVRTSGGDPSERILALTNKHVVSADPSTDYELDEANPQHILVCGERRFAQAIAEIEKAVKTGLRNATSLQDGVARLEAEVGTSDENERAENEMDLRRGKNALEWQIEDNATLRAFRERIDADWRDTKGWRFGIVDWAPRVSSVSVDGRSYSRDIATICVDREKLKNFKGNVIDLGNQYTSIQLEDLFWPDAAVRRLKNFPFINLQLPIRRALPRHVLNPDGTNDQSENGDSPLPSDLSIVGKYGGATKLTLGHYSGMEAFICNDLGEESREVVVYNYRKASGDFANYGDSGSLVFTGDGDAVAVLHSGMPRGGHNHVSYGTPVWWVMEQVRARYPFAEFCGIEYT
ncbi:hypothetical protein DFP72DRAFT_1064405 [Ephemerocybe angulata]|uniref:Uncharacterized protein n=1 Tax=Ephemerocybe angulata TaxID=980116 RepID=A0A8H6I4R8_9AGAR|nr:hypothetical protein DFP72DRAFT_1064405 [Tulosesus angulatus]